MKNMNKCEKFVVNLNKCFLGFNLNHFKSSSGSLVKKHWYKARKHKLPRVKSEHQDLSIWQNIKL